MIPLPPSGSLFYSKLSQRYWNESSLHVSPSWPGMWACFTHTRQGPSRVSPLSTPHLPSPMRFASSRDLVPRSPLFSWTSRAASTMSILANSRRCCGLKEPTNILLHGLAASLPTAYVDFSFKVPQEFFAGRRRYPPGLPHLPAPLCFICFSITSCDT